MTTDRGTRATARRKELVRECGDSELLFADYFDGAIVGLAKRCGQPYVVAYDREKCIALLMSDLDLDWNEAEEWFTVNAEGAWYGERTPVYLQRVPPELRTEREPLGEEVRS